MSVQETLERTNRAGGVPAAALPHDDDGKAAGTGRGGVEKIAIDNAAQRASASLAPRRAIRRLPEPLKRWGVRLFAIVVAIGVWHYLTAIDFNYVMNFENVPEPLVVANSFIGHVQTGEFYIHVLVSIKRILIAYSFAVVLGILIGLLMGRSRLAEDFFIPYIEVLRPIPAVAWIPLAILMWPTEESSIMYITFLGAFFPIVINTVHGAEQTPEVLVRAAQSLGASRVEIFWHVVIPAALPSIAAGLAIGMGVSWFSLLAGEIISGQYGIGYFTWNAYSLIEYPNIVVGMLVIGGLGTLSTYLVKLATQPLLRWQKAERGR
jgi:NitT/TauT family transport system permease protein